MRRRRVSPVHGVSRWRLMIKGTLAGKVAAALRRQRGAPLAAARSRRAAGRDRPSPAPTGSRRFRVVYLLLCGPGELAPLSDTLDSIAAWEGADAKAIVVDDATVDARRPHIIARHPHVDVVRMRWPTAGPPRLSPAVNLGLRAALARYEFDVLCKLDTDAVVTGPGLGAAAARRFAADPGLGMLGTVSLRADGVPEDHTYDAWLLRHERRWSRAVGDRLARAEAGTYDGRKAHGGVYVVARRALEAVAAAGDLHRSPPWWSQMPEDTWMSLAVCAAGFRIGSWGAPGEPTASASKWLPVPLAEIGPRGLLAVHSVRRGADGETEAAVRAALRAQRPSAAS
jgi:hypothetical protein